MLPSVMESRSFIDPPSCYRVRFDRQERRRADPVRRVRGLGPRQEPRPRGRRGLRNARGQQPHHRGRRRVELIRAVSIPQNQEL